MSARAIARPLEVVTAPRQRILDAALELLADVGYDGMSLQMVASRVGLHKSTLFHHFKNKDELAHEVFSGIAQRLWSVVAPAIERRPPELAHLLDLSDVLVEHFARDPTAARLLMRLMVANREFGLGGEGAGRIIERILVAIGEWITAARRARVIRRVDVRHTLMNFMGLALFYPATVHCIGTDVLAADPWGRDALALRKREMRAFLREALEPR